MAEFEAVFTVAPPVDAGVLDAGWLDAGAPLPELVLELLPQADSSADAASVGTMILRNLLTVRLLSRGRTRSFRTCKDAARARFLPQRALSPSTFQ
jgi:hypothetical protein